MQDARSAQNSEKLCSDLAPILFGLFLISKMFEKETAVHDASNGPRSRGQAV